MYAYKERKAESSGTNENIVKTVIDSTVDVVAGVGKLTVDGVTAVGKLTVDVVTAPFYAISYIWPKSKTNLSEKQYFQYKINLDLYLQYSVQNKLNKEQKLVICAAAASLPSGNPSDDENNRKILIALLASAFLATSGVGSRNR